MNNNEYLNHLYRQYMLSKGNINIDNYNYDNEEFIKWLNELKENTLLYKNFLLDMDIMVDSQFSCEIGKSSVDTISGINTQVLSLYMPSTDFDEYNIMMYLTHNSYNLCDIETLYKKCKNKIGICYGVYGNNGDKNKDEQLESIYRLYEKISNIADANMSISTKDNIYMSSVYTKRRLKYK